MATTRNAITGALIKSKPSTQTYRDKYEDIDWSDKGEKAKDTKEDANSTAEEGCSKEST